jgi:twitching motility two-component system response regulator PilH
MSMATILIADDSPTALTLLQRILSPLGHRIVTAADGEEAQRALKDEPPDLVILDVVMPKLNGFELCRALKADPATASIPIFFVTSMDREADRWWGLKQGADEYIMKPVDAGQLVEKVRARLAA